MTVLTRAGTTIFFEAQVPARHAEPLHSCLLWHSLWPASGRLRELPWCAPTRAAAHLTASRAGPSLFGSEPGFRTPDQASQQPMHKRAADELPALSVLDAHGGSGAAALGVSSSPRVTGAAASAGVAPSSSGGGNVETPIRSPFAFNGSVNNNNLTPAATPLANMSNANSTLLMNDTNFNNSNGAGPCFRCKPLTRALCSGG